MFSADMMEGLLEELRTCIEERLSVEDLLVIRQVSQEWQESVDGFLQRTVLSAEACFSANDHVGWMIVRLYRLGRGFRRAIAIFLYIASNLVWAEVTNNG